MGHRQLCLSCQPAAYSIFVTEDDFMKARPFNKYAGVMNRAEVLYFVDMLRNSVAFPDSSPVLAGRQRLLSAASATSCCCVYGH
jgi:hypothetical protein